MIAELTLLRHIGYRGNHRGNAGHARSEAHGLCDAHLSTYLAGHDDFASRLNLRALAHLAHHAVHVDDVSTAFARVQQDAGAVSILYFIFMPFMLPDAFVSI